MMATSTGMVGSCATRCEALRYHAWLGHRSVGLPQTVEHRLDLGRVNQGQPFQDDRVPRDLLAYHVYY